MSESRRTKWCDVHLDYKTNWLASGVRYAFLVLKYPALTVKVNAQGVPITESDEITADLHVRLNFSTRKWNLN